MTNVLRPDAPQRLGRRRPGLTAKEAGKKVGRSARTIRRWSSIPREEWLAQAEAKKRRAQELRATTGMSIRAIAKEMGCSPAAVHRYVSEKH